MGKVYEASTLLAYAKDRMQAYKAFDEQLDVLKKALHAVATLDHEFQGKGADSIKGFYTSQIDMVTHWKSLVSSHQAYFNSIADYAEQAKLKGDTVVDVSFLEQELAVANDRSKQMVEQQQTELEAILSNIEDIIHITPFSTEAFEDELSVAEKKRTETITAVEELDNKLSSEYEMLNSFYESVQFSVNGLEQLTSQGGSAYQLTFDAKAYKNSEAYETQQQIDKVATGYVEGKAEQKQEIKERKAAIEAERQRQIQANKPWYEKGLDIAGELTGYYDFKRAADGVDPVTHKKLSATQRVTAGAMAAAGFIPFVGWAGRAVKGGSVIYKTAKGMSAAHHAMALYQTPKAFKVLEQTEKGLYGLVLTNGMYEYTMGKDLLGNKLTKEEQQASLFQSFGVAAGGLLASKASTQLVEKGAQAVTKKFNDMRNVVRTSKVTQYGKDIQQAMRKMPAAGIDKAKKMYDAVLDAKVPRFLPQEASVGVSVGFAQQTVRDVLKSTAKDTMNFMGKDYFDGKRWHDARGRFIKKKDPNHVSKMENSQVESLKEDSKIDKTTHSISVVENNTNRYSGTGVKINSDLIKRYIKDVEMRTSRKLSKNQIEKLKEALRNKEYQKLSPIETRKHRRAFNKIKDKLIEEWEIKTGQKWPTYSEDIISENTGEPVRRKGDKYDAHHIIENSFRGEHEWWNIPPAKFPNEHQSGIHGTGSPANELFKGDN
ncbi:T7SS effector LXG polymorphic toxin [Priestia flexa]|uniref:T7SS effector LXG polymorphic toxin n=1 Tax=Priestia flexa TaxID=86664 RepID=UPI00095510F7|nr:T7SS effector LXG polymorphic toxin [Priestia flexa]MBY6088134.1 ribonuclease YeeF family protein [Priestia flexa]SIR38458.1 Predicted ribonuclease, toxin component of the YeeF-YezG toxin-antitoxin module [Priestia flexa]